MTTNKKYKLDITETLRAIKPGESVSFRIAGAGMETTYNSLHTTKTALRLPLIIEKSDDGLTATVKHQEQ